MKSGCLLTACIVGAVLICPVVVQAGPAEQAFARGEALLARGDFHGAMQAYAKAALADQTNQDYRQQYALLRQVIAQRQLLDVEKDPQRWEYFARGLHAFYIAEGLYAEALALDREIHAKSNTASSAKLLAETQLALDMNAEAAETLAALDPDKATPATRALYGLALARQGKINQARQIANTVLLPDDAGPGAIYSTARMHAAVGNANDSLLLLTRCFQRVAPSQLDQFKVHAKQSPEFAALASTAEFAHVLKTKSEVAESKCSGGSRCAGCPMRGSCPSSQGR